MAQGWHDKFSPPSPSPTRPTLTRKPSFETPLSLFLFALSLITSIVILSEFVVSYPRIFLSFVLPYASKQQLDLAEFTLETKLQTLEWHTQIHASALAFGALVFVWYRIIILGLESLIELGKLFGLECTTTSHSDDEDSGSGSNACVEKENESPDFVTGNSRNKHASLTRACVSILLGIIIINDCIFNRTRLSVSASSLSNSVISLSVEIKLIQTILPGSILPGAITRLISMASRAFPICVAEVSVLFLVLYGIGWVSYYRSDERSSRTTTSRSTES
ncbi:hypothetical protein BT96DRAFT_928009 [Gymnopus androsaceus JB14]|uniref:Uncharacterized protein n=1 Tax=Gymnopus androsaceus JB14 TaxID=1447944 RepID=A0A6A4GNA8_9AGAR|nr:hypothetical protein BT96DRAFT_928009 [Gymnopus androsaceus JB14]